MFSLMPRRREGKVERREYPLETLRREFASLFNRAFAGWPISWETPWEAEEPWGMTMEEREREVVVRAELPGFEASELEVQLRGEELLIRAEHKEKTKEGPEGKEGEHVRRVERVMTMPAGIEPEKIEARYHSGVLEVKVPRTPEAQPKRIEVKT